MRSAIHDGADVGNLVGVEVGTDLVGDSVGIAEGAVVGVDVVGVPVG